MNENLHDIDNIFYNSLDQHEESPSLRVWESLNASLDKKEAAFYKKKFIGLSRITAVLILLLASLVIHDAALIKNGSQGTALQTIHSNSVDAERNTEDDSVEKVLDNKTENTESHFLSSLNMEQRKHKLILQKPDQSNDTTHDSINYKAENDLTGQNKIVTSNGNNTVSSKTSTDNGVIPLTPGILNEKIKIYKEPPVKIDTVVSAQQKELVTKENYAIPKNKDTSFLSIDNKSLIVKHKSFHPYWSATVFGNREWAQYNLENDVQENNNNQTEDNRTAITKREKHEPSYTFGMLATYQFQKKLSFQTGLSYLNTAIAIEPQKVFAVKDYNGSISYKYNTSSGYAFLKTKSGTSPILGDSLYTTAAQHNLEYISIPVLMRYKILHKNFSVSAGIGVAVNLLTAAKIQTEIQNISANEIVSVNRLQGMKSFYTDALANADVQYNIKGNWSVNLITTFRFALSPINKNNIVKTFPYSFGLGMGCTYKF